MRKCCHNEQALPEREPNSSYLCVGEESLLASAGTMYEYLKARDMLLEGPVGVAVKARPQEIVRSP